MPKNAATAKPAQVQFSFEEEKILLDAVSHVWDEVAYDVLQGVAEEKGKDINAITVSRAVVIEVALDAGRPEELLEADLRRGRPGVTRDLLDRWEATSYEQKIAMAKKVFTYTRYGT